MQDDVFASHSPGHTSCPGIRVADGLAPQRACTVALIIHPTTA
ncbi:hypothetical protein [Pseudomonas sp. 6D_7.1_Bac1]|nr:hypothetical protein [Pseudomonas sp. 6D_7.1_Bac1]MCU1752833.1 hypothetical protein [Pseudomonas sp. 6D_7.1_Bac1]